ncbi:DNA-binding protein [Paraburkholderia domus]|uniref:DNA-binding protein n=1 Tax=Paraburkholderia domus TaxID=2793075 RepID=UPI001911391C|nr:DNA-binding protein [Paraburkholderia domus]MBK5065998.1 DNA-binding protein [Burkholderia sp. R-70199]CAE6964997.1 hypothetical protein R70199_07619 [Paraburkholderia domus]
MARDPSITQEQVSRAAAAIRDAGSRPTARNIRAQLGAGSMATVLKFLKAWQDAQVRPPETPAALPQSLSRGLLEFVAAEVDRSKQDLQAELDVAQQENADLILEAERQALIVDNLTGALEAVHGEKAALAGRLAQVEADLESVRHEAATERQAAEMARTETARATLRLEAMPRLENDLNIARRQVDTERAGRISAEQVAAVAEAKLAAAVDARLQLDQSRAEAKERERVVRNELANVRAELKDVRADLTKEHARTAALQSEAEARGRPRARLPRPATGARKKS